PGVGTEGTVEAAAGADDCLRAVLDGGDALEGVAGLDHLRGLAEDQAGLFAVAGGAVHLSAGLAVGEHEGERDGREQRGLAVLLGRAEVPTAEASGAVRSLPSEERADDAAPLPFEQVEGSALVRAGAVDEESDEER